MKCSHVWAGTDYYCPGCMRSIDWQQDRVCTSPIKIQFVTGDQSSSQ